MATLKTFDGRTLSYDLNETDLILVIHVDGNCVTLCDYAAHSVYTFLRQERLRRIPYRRTLAEIMDLVNLVKDCSLDENSYIRF